MGKNSYNNNSINACADEMLSKIMACVKEEIKKVTHLDSAVVSSVNEDGTVNVYFPPDNANIFTRISNQTPFSLSSGDSVEIILKDGSYSNCWIIAKHGATFVAPEVVNTTITKIVEVPVEVSSETTTT